VSCSIRGPRLLCVIALVVLLPLAATAAPTNKADEAAALSVVAASKAKSGAYAMCADLYVQAYRLDPSYLGYLYSAARCWQKAKRIDDAERGYRAFLKRAPKEHPLHSRARSHLDEIIENRGKTPVNTGKDKTDGAGNSAAGTTKPTKPGGTTITKPLVPPDKPMSGTAMAGWGAVIGGGLIGVTGIVLTLLNESDRAQLKQDLTPKSGFALIHDESHASAQERADDVNGRGIVAFSLTGIGIVAAVTGAYLVWSDDDKRTQASIVPTGRGALLRVAF